MALFCISCQKDECDKVEELTQKLNENIASCGNNSACIADQYRQYQQRVDNLDCD